jgi:N,N'-diacetyl-8-epilegionaminate cytidylyltransferase
MKPYVVAGVFARGGSKGVPKKNIRLLHGKPLLAYAIEHALNSSLIDRVIVSTDDAEIASVARQYGAEVPFIRPAELAGDDSPEWNAWQHAISTLNGESSGPRLDAFVCVPATSPLRKSEDLDCCIRTLLAGDADIVITVRHAERNPYFNMVTIDAEGYAHLAAQPEQETFRRQDAPTMFDITTVAYAARPSFVLSSSSMFKGKVRAVVVPAERALDIDTEFDFQLAEFLMSKPHP